MATAGAAGTTSEYIQPQFSTDTNSAVAGGIQGMLGNDGYLNSVMGNWYNQTPSQGALGQYAQYDATKMDQFMNPYTSNVIDANNQASNQNLMENVMPGVNSTFTGNGQFGSTRNSDFLNRAIRDNQQTLNNTNATTLYNAQNQANTNYKDWTNMGTTAGQNDFNNWMTLYSAVKKSKQKYRFSSSEARQYNSEVLFSKFYKHKYVQVYNYL